MPSLPTPRRMYQAVADRDPEFRGVFVLGVRTTGIFCRVGCPAKTPKPENCEFFATPRDALLAGYRACMRCRPLDGDAHPHPLIHRLIELVDADPAARISDERLRSLGIEPTTARRVFLRHCGMTFHAYHRARRMGSALSDLRTHKDIPRAMHTAGYESFSGFGEAFRAVFGAPPSGAAALSPLVADWMETPLGPMVAVADDHGLCLLEFCDRRALQREIEQIRRRCKAPIVPGRNAHIDSIRRELTEYLAGQRTEFQTPIVLRGSDFQRSVWNTLLEIPCAETRSYRDIAVRIGSPGSVRAVGRANGQNQLAIIVPCHRVIGADGSLTGYGGGIWRKQWLLDHEAKIAGRAPAPRQLTLAL